MPIDMQSFEDVIKVADAGLRTSKAAVEMLGKLRGLLKAPEAASDTDVELAMSDLRGEILQAQVANQQLHAQLLKLQEAALREDEFRNKLARYELWQTPVGDVVYRLREDDQAGEPIHLLCPNCLNDKRVFIILQGRYTKTCTRCGSHFRVDREPPISALP